MRLFTRIAAALLAIAAVSGPVSAQTTGATVTGLPNFDHGSGPEARLDTLNLTLVPGAEALHGAPGDTIGWGFSIQWSSNAGDYVRITKTRLTGDISAISIDGYQDIIGGAGGDTGAALAPGASWQQPFRSGATGLGGLLLSANAVGGGQYAGQLRVDYTVYDDVPDVGEKLISSFLLVDVVITVDGAPPSAPADQTLTFEPLADKSVSDPPFTIAASASGSLPIDFVSETGGVCAVSDAVVTLLSAGTCTITASQDGDGSFNAAWPVSQSFAVRKATATVAIDGPFTQVYDGSPKPLSVTTTPAGLTVIVSYNGDENAPSLAGSYAVSAVIDDASYEGAAAATLTLSRRSALLGWSEPSSIIYGTALGAAQLNATASTPGSFSYQPAVGTRLTAGAQTLTVTFTPTDTAQFDVATMTVPLTVDKATLTVSGPTLTREFGAANPALQPVYDGFVVGDSVASLAGSPSLTVAATPVSQPGAYPINVTPGSLASPNYTFAAVNGSLTVVDTTAPVLTLPSALTATAYREAGIAVTYSATAFDAVDGSRVVTCAPVSGSVFAPGSTTVTCSALDSRGNRSSGAFTVAVTLALNRIGRFVAFSSELTFLREGTTVVTGDVGANERRRHSHRREEDDQEEDERSRTEVTVRIGERVSMQQPTSRVVGDTVRLLNRASVYDVVSNVLFKRRAAVLGQVTTPMTPLPYLTLPVMPAISVGTTPVTVRRNQTVTLAAGAYGNVSVESGATLVLAGGLYQMRSLDVGQNATVRFGAATELRIKTALDTANNAKLVLDPGVSGLRASHMVIYVEGTDEASRRGRRDDDGDDHGSSVVSFGSENRVQANIIAPNGTIWMRSKMQGTGAFIGGHLRVGQKSTLTLDSAFR